MNIDQIVNMVMRLFLRKGVNWGINKGTGLLARRGPAKPGGPKSGAPQGSLHTASARDVAKRARKAARITRRLGR